MTEDESVQQLVCYRAESYEEKVGVAGRRWFHRWFVRAFSATTFQRPQHCFRWTQCCLQGTKFQWPWYCLRVKNTVSVAKILIPYGKNTVLVATVELPQFTVSLFPRLGGCTAGVSPPGKWHLLLALLQSIAGASIAKYYQQHLHIISNQQIELN